VSLVMHDVDAFEHRVSAYPAIVVLRRKRQGQVLVAEAGDGFDPTAASSFQQVLINGPGRIRKSNSFKASWSPGWFEGSQSWPDATPRRLAMLAQLEQRFPPLLDVGVRVGVGVATGADSVYVVDDKDGLEEDRLLPTLSARETR